MVLLAREVGNIAGSGVDSRTAEQPFRNWISQHRVTPDVPVSVVEDCAVSGAGLQIVIEGDSLRVRLHRNVSGLYFVGDSIQSRINPCSAVPIMTLEDEARYKAESLFCRAEEFLGILAVSHEDCFYRVAQVERYGFGGFVSSSIVVEHPHLPVSSFAVSEVVRGCNERISVRAECVDMIGRSIQDSDIASVSLVLDVNRNIKLHALARKVRRKHSGPDHAG